MRLRRRVLEMGRGNIMRTIAAACLLLTTLSCAQTADTEAIRAINEKYVTAWLENDAKGVLSLFEDDATIVPSGMTPIQGIRAIGEFWFPKDSSRTTINQFNNEILSIAIEDTLATSSQKTFLSWSYEKGDVRIAKDQWGLAMALYRRQADGTWKIWRQLWTDVRSAEK